MQKFLDFVKELFTARYFYITIGSVFVFGIVMLLLFDKIIMPGYTNYNEGVTVPDVTRISLNEAEQLLSSYGLRVEVSDRRANSAFPADYVIDQQPSASVIVKPNRKIYLTVNAAVKPTVEVPNLVNLSLRNAQIQLQNYGLQEGSISYESSRFKNAVLRQSLPEGTVVEKGTSIDLVVSDGLGSKIIDIPEIVGLRLPDAQLKLRVAGIRVGEITFQPIRDVTPNTVLNYSPKVSQIVEGGTLNLIIAERFEAVEVDESGAVIIDSTGNNNNDNLPPQPDNQNDN